MCIYNLQTMYLLKRTDENGFEEVGVTTNKEHIPIVIQSFDKGDEIFDDPEDDPTDVMLRYADELNVGESGHSRHWWGMIELFILRENQITDVN